MDHAGISQRISQLRRRRYWFNGRCRGRRVIPIFLVRWYLMRYQSRERISLTSIREQTEGIAFPLAIFLV
jgi:hypothetical protein